MCCCHSALRECLRGIGLCVALGGLAALLGGLHALAPLAAQALDPAVAWFSLVLCTMGCLLLILGLAAGLGLTPAAHCLTGASLALLPVEVLMVWAYAYHGKQLRWLADRDQTYALTAILDWTDAHLQLAAGLAGIWLVLQAAAALLGAVYACCPAMGRRQRHPWDRYWTGEPEERREPLLPRSGTGSPRAAGYHTPPSRFQSPYQSPGRAHPPAGPLMASAPPLPPTVPVS